MLKIGTLLRSVATSNLYLVCGGLSYGQIVILHGLQKPYNKIYYTPDELRTKIFFYKSFEIL